MSDKRYRIKIAAEKTTVSTAVLALLKGDDEVKPVDPLDGDPVDLMILEATGADGQILETVETLLSSGKSAELFLLSGSCDAEFLMKLMRIGIKEFFPLPLDEKEFSAAIKRFKDRHRAHMPAPTNKRGRLISVVGSKGGAGATTIAVNLAMALSKSRQSASTVLFDFNPLFGELPLFLDLTPQYHWGDVMDNMGRLDDMFLMNILARHSSGVHLLPSPAYLNGKKTPSVEMADRLLALMRTLFDFIIVDTGLSMEETGLRMFQHSDDVLLVSQLNVAGLSNANRLVKSLTDLGYITPDRLKVIINRYQKKSEMTLEDARSGIEKEIFFAVPNDYKNALAAANQGRPIFLSAPKSPLAKSFTVMAEKFLPETEEDMQRKWGWFRIKRKA